MPTYLDLSRKSMPSLKTTTHPPAIRYETESRIKNIKTANQNLAQIIMEERKIKGEKPKKTATKKDGPRSSLPPAGRPEARGTGLKVARRRSRPWGRGRTGPKAVFWE
jgi:hypothetical protein